MRALCLFGFWILIQWAFAVRSKQVGKEGFYGVLGRGCESWGRVEDSLIYHFCRKRKRESLKVGLYLERKWNAAVDSQQVFAPTLCNSDITGNYENLEYIKFIY